jgi:signal transduction histidine kinase
LSRTPKRIPETAMIESSKFRARARALDMLGRQQIAGIPTAINELFKNAHDAYANDVVVDYYEERKLFVLGDDGLGMTREDFETRWLALGTESKVGIARQGSTPPPGFDPRPIMGEKGIGRLAIAVIGPQVLVVTRHQNAKNSGELTAAFINWTLFEVPGLNLEDVQIPIRTFADGKLPGGNEIQELVAAVRKNVEELSSRIDKDLYQKILDQLDEFRVDPKRLENGLNIPKFERKPSGTRFYIMPTDENLAVDVNQREEGGVSSIQAFLLGFTDTMTPRHEPPKIQARFLHHPTDVESVDLLDQREFWNQEEFQQVDHWFSGDFDENGNFQGTVSIYGKEVPWFYKQTNLKVRQSTCGPFKIDLGYVQGLSEDTLIELQTWSRFNEKLRKIGGLYIYRDGIRILPYGLSSNDWLELERNRSKKASYYYFSYRRMFGSIRLTGIQNTELQEKAGREGFRENAAYRQFKAILKEFFVNAAAEFFRENAAQPNLFIEPRKELQARDRAKKELEEESKAHQKRLQKLLDDFFIALESGELQRQINNIVESARRDLILLSASITNDAAEKIANIEIDAKKKVDKLLDQIRVTIPTSLALTKTLQRDFSAYEREQKRLEKGIIAKAQTALEQAALEAASLAQVKLDRRNRLGKDTINEITKIRTQMEKRLSAQEQAHTDLRKRIASIYEYHLGRTDEAKTKLESVLEKISDESKAAEEIRLLQREVKAIGELAAQNDQVVLRQMQLTAQGIEEGQITGQSELVGAFAEEVLTLRDQVEEDLELVKLGQAIEVINHEFQQSVVSIRSNLRSLEKFKNSNPALGKIYQNLHVNFEHLDNYLTLFTPLHKRLYRESTTMIGSDIATYLKNLFQRKLLEHQIEIQISQSFEQLRLTGFPSTFYPVFINLIDNAVHWVASTGEPGWIRLDVHSEVITVSDSGPGILARDAETIFEYGFSRKIGGRGIGLYIARQVLRSAGYDIRLRYPNEHPGACFEIYPVSQTEPSK